MNSFNQRRPGFLFFHRALSRTQPPYRAIQSNNIGPRDTDRFGRPKVRRNMNLAVRVEALHNPDNRQLGDSTKSLNPFGPFCPQPSGPTAQNRSSHPHKRPQIIKWISLRGLAGDDETSAKCLDRRVERGVREWRHVETFLVCSRLLRRRRKQLICLAPPSSSNRAIVDE